MAGEQDRKTFYITTPIYYPSGKLHIGHAYTTVAADCIARYKRQCGLDTRFLTGTDEHGIKIMRSAEQAAMSPQQWVDLQCAEIKNLWRILDISYDDFLRTTESRHARVVEAIFEQLYRQGDIYKGAYEGLYCAPCENFLLERQVADGNCPDCGRPPEQVSEEAYFFRMSRYQARWLQYVEDNPEFIQPLSRRNEMTSFVRQGLEDLCVSRTTFDWGIKLPFDSKHVVYVWIDALTNYISALGYGEPGSLFERYWPADVHLMAKEIVRHHAVIWPIILMAARIELPRRVFGHGWLVLEGEKMSKSKGNVIDPAVLVDKYGLDAVRYFLLRAMAFGADGNYSEDALVLRTNVDLANDLGNLVHRTLAMVERFADGRVPAPDPGSPLDRPLVVQVAKSWQEYQERFERLDLPAVLGAVMDLVGRANKYIDEQAPWSLVRDSATRPQAMTVLYDLLETVRIAAVLMLPAMPQAPREILRQIGLDPDEADCTLPGAIEWGGLPPGLVIRKGNPIFPRIDPNASPGPNGASAGGGDDGGSDEESSPPSGDKLGQQSDQISYADFGRVDLRVAKVVEAERVEGTDRLLKLQIDLPEGRRQIVAGIAEHYSPDEMVGRDVVVVANLAPASIRGHESRGMLLAASHGTELVLVGLDRSLPPGAKVK